MSKQPAKRLKFGIDGFAKPSSIGKFSGMVAAKYETKVLDDKGEYTSLHLRVTAYPDQRVEVILYSTGTLTVSCSPYLDTGRFEAFARDIEKMAKSSTQSVGESRPLAVVIAKELNEFAHKFDTADERQRMVAVIVSDTANEIVLREMMISQGIEGEALEKGVPKKIEYLEGKGEIVYMKEQVKQIRELRNGIAHRGTIPSKEQANMAIKWSTDFVNAA